MVLFFPRKKKPAIIFKLVFLLALLGLGGMSYYLYSVNVPVTQTAAPQSFIVREGEGSTIISHNLKNAGLIRSALAFQYYTWRSRIGHQLKPGEYFLSQSDNLKEIANILWRGPGVTKERTLTFIEGWTLSQYADYLEKENVVPRETFISLVQKKQIWWDEFSILDSRPKTVDLEGYLFPDTYRIYNDAAPEEIIRKMLANLEKKITPEMLQEIEQQRRTVHEVLTLASIIEKEVSLDTDRKLVADIFYKRLAAGIALQADSTVNYATGKSQSRASGEDLAIDSPYNTYRYKGLPPGPIANPGLSAIEAAVYPTPNEYWFFLTTPDGQAIYSKTYDEHVAAKNKYY